MSRCKKCGTQTDTEVVFCPRCGAQMEAGGQPTETKAFRHRNAPAPGKVKFLLGAMAALAILDVGFFATGGGWTSLFFAAVKVALIIGVLKGSEGVRIIVMGLAALSMIYGIVLVIAALSMGLGMRVPVFGILSIAWPAYMIWCLRCRDVQEWMFSRTTAGQMDWDS